jgi:hypothetical protein
VGAAVIRLEDGDAQHQAKTAPVPR